MVARLMAKPALFANCSLLTIGIDEPGMVAQLFGTTVPNHAVPLVTGDRDELELSNDSTPLDFEIDDVVANLLTVRLDLPASRGEIPRRRGSLSHGRRMNCYDSQARCSD